MLLQISYTRLLFKDNSTHIVNNLEFIKRRNKSDEINKVKQEKAYLLCLIEQSKGSAIKFWETMLQSFRFEYNEGNLLACIVHAKGHDDFKLNYQYVPRINRSKISILVSDVYSYA